MSQVHQPSKKYTNVARLVHLRQVHPLKLAASVQICEICGRSSPAEASVNSVQSVGGLLFAWLVQQRLLHPLKLHLCNLWETIPNRRFCEFCAICGRSSPASRSNPWEPLCSHPFSPHYKHCVLFRAAHGAWADREQTGSRQE